MRFEQKLMQYAAAAQEAVLNELICREGADTLYEAMRYSVAAGGKRIRPALCLAACELASGDWSPALYAAAAMEMIHTYSLIHDDLPAMDNDDLRRGRPTSHRVFGEAGAILAGDGLLSQAFCTLAKTQSASAMAEVAHGAMDMVLGQTLDMNPIATEESLRRMHMLKTGALFTAAVRSGAILGRAEETVLAALTAFSQQFGLLFQITDDLLDVTGDAGALGKSVGKDAAEDKCTYVTLYGAEQSRILAKQAATAAVDALASFGEASWFFKELTQRTLTRDR